MGTSIDDSRHSSGCKGQKSPASQEQYRTFGSHSWKVRLKWCHGRSTFSQLHHCAVCGTGFILRFYKVSTRPPPSSIFSPWCSKTIATIAAFTFLYINMQEKRSLIQEVLPIFSDSLTLIDLALRHMTFHEPITLVREGESLNNPAGQGSQPPDWGWRGRKRP